jgi:hypothetical protein
MSLPAFHRLALAIAQLDDPLPHQGRHLDPGAGLHDACGIHDLGRLAALRGHESNLRGTAELPEGAGCHEHQDEKNEKAGQLHDTALETTGPSITIEA